MSDDKTPAKYDGRTHFYGAGSVILAGVGIPALLYLSSKPKLTDADKWVLRGVALSAAVVIAPLGYMYLQGLSKQ